MTMILILNSIQKFLNFGERIEYRSKNKLSIK